MSKTNQTSSEELLSLSDAIALVHHEAQSEFLRMWKTGATRTSNAAETLPLEQAEGRVLARTLLANTAMPSFDRSTRDGFAARAEELNSGKALRVARTLQAGQHTTDSVATGECWKIMTGAALPAGADCVVMLEHVEHVAEGQIQLTAGRKIEAGAYVVPAGAEAEEGAVLIQHGTRIRAQEIALLAAMGVANPVVFRQPRVGVFSTGNEVVPLLEQPQAGQLRDTNSLSLAELARQAGAVVEVLPIVPDDRAAMRAALHATAEFDALVMTGGVSAGEFDLVEEVLAECGAELHFTGVKIQPGKPSVLAHRQRRAAAGGRWQWIFALPGSPISAMVTFQLFARPLIAALGGERAASLQLAWAPLIGTWKGQSGLTRFLPGALTAQGVELIPWQGSGDLRAFARGNCCVVVPESVTQLTAGEFVNIWQWPHSL